MLVDVIFKLQDTEDFRSYLSEQLENCNRTKLEVIRQKEALELKH